MKCITHLESPLTFLFFSRPFREGVCGCVRLKGVSTVWALCDRESTSPGLPKTVNQPNTPFLLLPPPPPSCSSFSYFPQMGTVIWPLVFWEQRERKQWSEGEKCRRIIFPLSHNPPLNKPPSKWKNKPLALSWPKHLCGFYCTKKKEGRHGEKGKQCSFPERNRMPSFGKTGTRRVIVGGGDLDRGTEAWGSLVGVCGQFMKKRKRKRHCLMWVSELSFWRRFI